MQIISKLHVAVASTCKHCVSFYCFYFHLLFQLLFASLVCLVFCLFVCLSVCLFACLLACFFGSCLLFLGRCGVYSLFGFVGGSAGAVVVLSMAPVSKQVEPDLEFFIKDRASSGWDLWEPPGLIRGQPIRKYQKYVLEAKIHVYTVITHIYYSNK